MLCAQPNFDFHFAQFLISLLVLAFPFVFTLSAKILPRSTKAPIPLSPRVTVSPRPAIDPNEISIPPREITPPPRRTTVTSDRATVSPRKTTMTPKQATMSSRKPTVNSDQIAVTPEEEAVNSSKTTVNPCPTDGSTTSTKPIRVASSGPHELDKLWVDVEAKKIKTASTTTTKPRTSTVKYLKVLTTKKSDMNTKVMPLYTSNESEEEAEDDSGLPEGDAIDRPVVLHLHEYGIARTAFVFSDLIYFLTLFRS